MVCMFSGTITIWFRLGKAAHFLSNQGTCVQEDPRYIAAHQGCLVESWTGEEDTINLNIKTAFPQLLSPLLSVAIHTLIWFLDDFVCSVLPLKTYLCGFSKARVKMYASLERTWKCVRRSQMGAILHTFPPHLLWSRAWSLPLPSALWVEEEAHLLLIDVSFGALLGSTCSLGGYHRLTCHLCLERPFWLPLVLVLSFLFLLT